MDKFIENHLCLFADLYYFSIVKIESEYEFSLMRVRDARILMVIPLFGFIDQYKKRLEQIKKIRENKQEDINQVLQI